MESQQPPTVRPPGCSKPVKACGCSLLVLIVVLVGLMIYAFRMPAVHDLLRCQSNMTAVGDALRRYHDVTGTYPRDLRAIEKEYLKDRNVLHCPLDKSPRSEISYTYNRPSAGAPADFVVLECKRHPVKLTYMKSGRVKAVPPEVKDTKKKGAR